MHVDKMLRQPTDLSLQNRVRCPQRWRTIFDHRLCIERCQQRLGKLNRVSCSCGVAGPWKPDREAAIEAFNELFGGT